MCVQTTRRSSNNVLIVRAFSRSSCGAKPCGIQVASFMVQFGAIPSFPTCWLLPCEKSLAVRGEHIFPQSKWDGLGFGKAVATKRKRPALAGPNPCAGRQRCSAPPERVSENRGNHGNPQNCAIPFWLAVKQKQTPKRVHQRRHSETASQSSGLLTPVPSLSRCVTKMR